MLHIEKIGGEKSTRIIVKNRLFYVLAVDGISHEEIYRLNNELYSRIKDAGNVSHVLWWEDQKIGVIFVTGEVLDNDTVDTQKMKEIIKDFESSEINVPHLSIMCGDTLRGILTASRLGMIAKDKEGEIAIFTNEELFTGCIRNN